MTSTLGGDKLLGYITFISPLWVGINDIVFTHPLPLGMDDSVVSPHPLRLGMDDSVVLVVGWLCWSLSPVPSLSSFWVGSWPPRYCRL